MQTGAVISARFIALLFTLSSSLRLVAASVAPSPAPFSPADMPEAELQSLVGKTKIDRREYFTRVRNLAQKYNDLIQRTNSMR